MNRPAPAVSCPRRGPPHRRVVRILPAQQRGDGEDPVGVDRAAGAAGAEFRLGHLWRRRLDARAHACDRQAHPGGNAADAGRASHLRRRHARRKSTPSCATITTPACAISWRCAAIRSAAPARKYAPHPGGYQNAADLVGRHQAHRGDFEISVSAYPEKHPDSPTVEADIDMLKAKVDAGAGARHHAVLLRERSLFPLSRPRARARHRYPDRAGHPAGAELQGGDQFRRARRRLGAGVAGRAFPRARQRSRRRAS